MNNNTDKAQQSVKQCDGCFYCSRFGVAIEDMARRTSHEGTSKNTSVVNSAQEKAMAAFLGPNDRRQVERRNSLPANAAISKADSTISETDRSLCTNNIQGCPFNYAHFHGSAESAKYCLECSRDEVSGNLIDNLRPIDVTDRSVQSVGFRVGGRMLHRHGCLLDCCKISASID